MSDLIEVKKVNGTTIGVDQKGKFHASIAGVAFVDRSIGKVEQWVAAHQQAVRVLHANGCRLEEAVVIGYLPPKDRYDDRRWLGKDGKEAYHWGRLLPYDETLLAAAREIQAEIQVHRDAINALEDRERELTESRPEFGFEDFDRLVDEGNAA